MDDEWCVTKVITPIILDELERNVALFSDKEEKEFLILTPAKVIVLVPSETFVRQKFVIKTTTAKGMTRSGRCYTLKEFALGGKKKDKDEVKSTISEGEAEELWRKM